MLRRRKLLLALLEAFGGRLERLRLQKLLFLLCADRANADYHFLPYKYGCFSFQANMDLFVLEKKGTVRGRGNGWEAREDGWLSQVTDQDRRALCDLKREYGKLSGEELVRYTYLHYPFYAIRSTIIQDHLSAEEQRRVAESVPCATSPVLATLGYEGLSLEQYLNVLLKQNIRLLCDVRKNAMSMKYGFARKTLSTACASVGIEYRHFPEVGIVSEKRKKLQTRADYETLFADYRATVLPNTPHIQHEIARAVVQAGRAALMCFEHEPDMCHRSHLANALMSHLGREFSLNHLYG